MGASFYASRTEELAPMGRSYAFAPIPGIFGGLSCLRQSSLLWPSILQAAHDSRMKSNRQGRNRGVRSTRWVSTWEIGVPGNSIRAPTRKVGAPGKTVGIPTEKVGAPGKKVGTPTEKVGTPGKKVGTPTEKVGAPGKKVGARTRMLRSG